MAPAAMFQRIAAGTRRALLARDVVRMATLGGAEALGMADAIGSLRVGKAADLIRVDTADPRWQPLYDTCAALVFSRPALRRARDDGRRALADARPRRADCRRGSRPVRRAAGGGAVPRPDRPDRRRGDVTGTAPEFTAAHEGALRRALIDVALGRAPADRLLRVGRLLDTATGLWREDVEIAVRRGRIAFVGTRGAFRGDAGEIVERAALSAVPGFGEVHKHIESSHVTPEYEAALVVPRGNTWTCEASHEFSNVVPGRTLDFWLAARRAGSPLKIFPLPGSAVPPTAWEHGARLDGHDQAAFLSASLATAGLDEVMDFAGLTDPGNPAHARLWSMIEATWAARGRGRGARRRPARRAPHRSLRRGGPGLGPRGVDGAGGVRQAAGRPLPGDPRPYRSRDRRGPSGARSTRLVPRWR